MDVTSPTSNYLTPPPYVAQETAAARLRRLATVAKSDNAIVKTPLLGAKPWKPVTAAISRSLAVTQGNLYSNGGLTYLCIGAGTTAASGGGPTGTDKINLVTDGTAQFIYYTGSVGDQVSNGGIVYQMTVAGVPSSAAGGPAGWGSAITDGTATWAAIGAQTAPVATVNASSNGSITQAFTLSSNLSNGSGYVRYKGGVPTAGAAGVWLPSVTMTPLSGQWSTTKNAIYMAFEVGVHDSLFQLRFYVGSFTFFRVLVDGVYISADPLVVSSNQTTQWLNLDWTNAGGRKPRRVEIEASDTAQFYQIGVSATGHLFYPNSPDDFSVGFVGDSMWNGALAVDSNISFVPILSRLLGFPDATSLSISGTGLITSGSATNYPNRALTDLANLNAFRPLGAIFVECSINDDNAISSIQAAATSFLASLRAAYSNVPIFVIGVFHNNAAGYIAGSAVPIENAWKAAVAATPGLTAFIPISSLASPLNYGTGNVGATAGDGPADIDTASDAKHPTAAGHLSWARGAAEGVRAVLSGWN